MLWIFMMRLFLRLLVLAFWAQIAHADTLSEALAAKSRGDFAAAYPLWVELAEGGNDKAAIEAFMHAHHAITGSAVTVLRPSNLYGPGQTTRGDFGVVPALLQCARDGRG